MRKKIEFSDLSSLNIYKDPCKAIDESLLSKRINKLNPSFPERPKTKSEFQKTPKKKFKIIPDLRLAVEIIQTRLNQSLDEKFISRPSTRMKIDPPDIYSPTRYHKTSLSTSGWEFSKASRLDSQIMHQIESILTHKKQENSVFSKLNKKAVQNISDFKQSVRKKIRNHNQEVQQRLQDFKFKTLEKINKKKEDFLYKAQNFKWKESFKEEIVSSKRGWALIFVVFSGGFLLNLKVRRRKEIKKNVERFLRIMSVCLRALGRFLVILKKKRKYLKYKNVCLFVSPFISHIVRETHLFRKAISRYLFKLVDSYQIVLLLAFWKRSILRIQRAYRRYSQVKEARVRVLFILYNKQSASSGRRFTSIPVKNIIEMGSFNLTEKKRLFFGYLTEVIRAHARSKRPSPLRLFSEKNKLVSFFSMALHKRVKRNTTPCVSSYLNSVFP